MAWKPANKDIKDKTNTEVNCGFGKSVQGLYYYGLDTEHLTEGITATSYNTSIFGLTTAIQNVVYVPYMDFNDSSISDFQGVAFDVKRYGWVGNPDYPNAPAVPYVYRVEKYVSNKKEIGTFTVYEPQKSIGGKRNWKNESRLYNFPYKYAILTDGIGEPWSLMYHNCPSNTASVFVATFLSNLGTYMFGVNGYKGDYIGNTEGIIVNRCLELPNSSSAYAQWNATQKASAKTNMFLGALQTGVSMVNPIVGAGMKMAGKSQTNTASENLRMQDMLELERNPTDISNLAKGNQMIKKGASLQGIQGGLGIMNVFQGAGQIASYFNEKQSAMKTPNTMISQGSDLNATRFVSGNMGRTLGGMYLYKYEMEEEYMEKCGTYFAMYGYTLNKFMKYNKRSRKDYNYLQTVGANVSADIPMEHKAELQAIYDKGVTIWHVDRNGDKMINYEYDNQEV